MRELLGWRSRMIPDRAVGTRSTAARLATEIRGARCRGRAVAVGVLAVRGARGAAPEPAGAGDARRRPGRAGAAGGQRVAATATEPRGAGGGAGATCSSDGREAEGLVRSGGPLRPRARAGDERRSSTATRQLAQHSARAGPCSGVAPMPPAAGLGDRPVLPGLRYVRGRRSSRCWRRPTRGSRSCSSTTARSRTRTGSSPSWRPGADRGRLADEQGLGAARNFGVSQSRGRYVFPLDADNVAEPEFVARCVEVLEQRHELAYVTSWSRYIEERRDAAPGPAARIPAARQLRPSSWTEENVAGDAAAVIRRRIFDARVPLQRGADQLSRTGTSTASCVAAGRYGAVIPGAADCATASARNRCRPQIAQPRRARLGGEMQALLRENEVQWKSSSV